MTTALTEEDALFDLDLRIIPLDAKDDYNANMAASDGCVHTSYVTEGCTRRCTAGYGCGLTNRGFAGERGGFPPRMCPAPFL
jgi:hypothetical protein